MTLIEIQRDLFSLPDEYILAHCISADFALGAGIAVQFAKRGVKAELKACYPRFIWQGHGCCIITAGTYRKTANLITKERAYYKPTLNSIREALSDFRDQLGSDSAKIGMPRIGCGLDAQKWEDVKKIIEQIFENTDHEIIVCYI